MVNILLGVLFIFISKEFIVLNDSFVISCVFLSLLFIFTKNINLQETFENVRTSEKNELSSTSNLKRSAYLAEENKIHNTTFSE